MADKVDVGVRILQTLLRVLPEEVIQLYLHIPLELWELVLENGMSVIQIKIVSLSRGTLWTAWRG